MARRVAPLDRPTAADAARLTIAVSPDGRLQLRDGEDSDALVADAAERLRAAFAQGDGAGLLQLGIAEVTTALPAVLGFWRELATRHLAAVCARGVDVGAEVMAPPDLTSLAALASSAPPMLGGEYVTAEVLAAAWDRNDEAFRAEAATHADGIAGLLRARHAAWHQVGRVHFNLAEHRGDEEAPFAFLATYTTRLSRQGRAQHVPLGQALQEFAGAKAKAELRALLEPVRRAAEQCPWLATLVSEGELFHPLRFTVEEARTLLDDVRTIERAGVTVRMPAQWTAGRPARVQAGATVGAAAPAQLGSDALLDFRAGVTLDGEPLTDDEIADLLRGTDGLRLLRGRWIELDATALQDTLARLRAAERMAADGVTFAEAMRLVAGAGIGSSAFAAATPGTQVTAGPWLAERLTALRSPEGLAALALGDRLRAELRPYQSVGVRWLYQLTQLGLGACLADDMGLGKTVQVIALLLAAQPERRGPALLIVPASLVGNWTDELARFAPTLTALVAHPSAMDGAQLGAKIAPSLTGVDVVITTYGTLPRAPWLTTTRWSLAIVDEAQAIKNPGARQTQAVKALTADARIALTGTPVENRLGDLWSLFDFLNPGLLGSAAEFTRYTKGLAATGYGPLRELVRPYLLRRLKTDRTVIADLPDKTELIAQCSLSRQQAALYQQAVDDLAARLATSRGIERRGAVLSSLMRLKQICNHPSQWLGTDGWDEAASGKLGRLRELCEVIAAKQEKVLVFTQFREATEPLAAFLATVFGRRGLVLHGDTAVKDRKALVKAFQDDVAVPSFVLSLKAGGTGLNLTAASHVVHFDRWWNPAVEDQATDRAFRIGQRRNVLVHKLVCRGTVEEKVDAMIATKRALATEILAGGELPVTELSDRELLELVALDRGRAMVEAS